MIILSLLSRSQYYGSKYIAIDVGVCALFGGYTVLSTKALSSLLSTIFLAAFADWITWVLVVVLVVTSVLQVKFLNRALMRFQSKASNHGTMKPHADLCLGSHPHPVRLLLARRHYRFRRVVSRVQRCLTLKLYQLCIWRESTLFRSSVQYLLAVDRHHLPWCSPTHIFFRGRRIRHCL